MSELIRVELFIMIWWWTSAPLIDFIDKINDYYLFTYQYNRRFRPEVSCYILFLFSGKVYKYFSKFDYRYPNLSSNYETGIQLLFRFKVSFSKHFLTIKILNSLKNFYLGGLARKGLTKFRPNQNPFWPKSVMNKVRTDRTTSGRCTAWLDLT